MNRFCYYCAKRDQTFNSTISNVTDLQSYKLVRWNRSSKTVVKHYQKNTKMLSQKKTQFHHTYYLGFWADRFGFPKGIISGQHLAGHFRGVHPQFHNTIFPFLNSIFFVFSSLLKSFGKHSKRSATDLHKVISGKAWHHGWAPSPYSLLRVVQPIKANLLVWNGSATHGSKRKAPQEKEKQYEKGGKGYSIFSLPP